MSNFIDGITIGEKGAWVIDADPSLSGGLSAVLGIQAVWDDGTTARMYLKTGAADTAWDLISTVASSGLVNAGVAGRLALYPASSNQVDDVYVQNSQNIDILVAAQGTRSSALEYTIPNPGDAVSAASFVLTEGAQTINGDKTFSNNVVVSGDLTVNGTVTSLATTNTAIKDALLTLNKGGLTASATNTGFEIEENALITGYFKTDSARDSFNMKAPATFEAELDLALLSANRKYQFPNAAGTLALSSSISGVVNQVPYFNATGTITSPTGVTVDSLFWDSVNSRLGIGNAAPSVALHVTGSARITGLSSAGIVHNDANGLLSTSALDLTADVGSSILPLANGGSNANLTASAGSIVYSSASAMVMSAVGTAGQALLSGGAAAPTWFSASGVVHATSGVLSASAVVLTSEVSGVLPVANGGTNSSAALTGKQIMVSNSGATAIIEAGAMTNGQLLIGSTGAQPVIAAITPTSNQVNVTNAAGSITLSLPQDIHTGASPTFLAQTLSGNGAFWEISDKADMLISTFTVPTTNATVTTIATIATVTDSVMLVEARITGIRTGGSAGTAGDCATYIRTVRVKNVAGTVTLLNLQSDFTSEDQLGFNGTITSSGTNVLVQVQGSTNNNMTWKAVVTKTY